MTWQFTWEPSKGSQTLPRWYAAGGAGRLPTRSTWEPSRLAWLAALPLWLSACVLPMSPEFKDPAGNYSPYVVSSSPAAGAELAPGSPDTIEATLGDPNVEDILVGRWLIDYPPYDEFFSRVAQEVTLPTTGAVKREPIRFAASCANIQSGSGLPSHRVTLSVADRPFLSAQEAPDLPLDSVPDTGFVVRTTWIVDLACP